MSDERRRYFRIDDTVHLRATPISPDDLESRIEDFWNNQHQFSIRNEYNHQLEEHLSDFHAIENKMPELARYLLVLQKQIELLTDKLIPEQDQFSDDGQSVNISGQGISFYSQEIARAGDVLELNLKLAPSGLQLVAFARVVLVEDHNNADQGKYKLSLDFEHIHDADQEILIKHVHGKQLSALGASRSDET